MKDRQKRMLRFLLSAEENVRIEDIAAAFEVGSRTVSRDLDLLENWLSIRGVFLERKTNKGIRILTYGQDPAQIMEIINTPESYFSDLSPKQRQSFIFLYLIYNSREVKIAEVANTFFISDTCVWNDLKQIEAKMEQVGLSLERLKGIGVRIQGDEKDLRMAFLRVFADVFTTKSIIPYIYCVKEKQKPGLEVNKLNLLLENLKISVDREFIFKLIILAEELLDCKFTASAESFLYFYLVLAGQRIHSGWMITRASESACHESYRDTAVMVLKKLTSKTMSGPIPSGEIDLLCLLFQACEWGDVQPDRWERIDSMIPEKTLATGRKLIALLGEKRNEYYYLDSGLEKTIRASLAALVLRVENRIPQWYDDWERPTELLTPEIEESVRTLLKDELGIDPDRQDIRSLFFFFRAAEVNPQQFLREKIRCLICCFEGIGLASYLYSIIRHDAPELDIVEATAVYKLNQRYLDLNRIDLVISTFPIADIETPTLIVPLPVDRKKLEHSLKGAMSRIKKEEKRQIKLTKILKEEDRKFSVSEVLPFIQNFTVGSWDRPFELSGLIKTIAETTAEDRRGIQRLEKDLLKREALGELLLPEFGIRIFHCKSSSVKTPRSGLLRLTEHGLSPNGPAVEDEDNPLKLAVYMIAPDPCPDNIRMMLSAFSVALMERPLLRKILNQGDEEKVRLGLFDLYHSLL